MRANLKAGKLHPEPRSIEHARRRMQQLDHEIDGITRARKTSKLNPTEVDLRQERALLAAWILSHRHTEEAMTMTTKKTEKNEPLNQKELHTIITALRTAAASYEADEKTFRQVATDLADGKSVPMFVAGDPGVKAAKRLADQFFRQREDALNVLTKLEDGEGGDGTVSR